MSKFAALDLGLVVAAHGRHCIVETPDGARVQCHSRGKGRGKNGDCVVGDRVRWQVSGDEGVVEQVAPRRNLLFRQDEWKTKSFAANLDQIMVLVAGEPVFSESQLARALIAAESAGIPARIVLNKADLPVIAAARVRLQPYVAMGIDVIELALKTKQEEARAILNPLLDGKATLVLKCDGDVGPRNGPRGDLILHVVVDPDPVLRRQGIDILMELQISAEQAREGTYAEVPTLKGTKWLRISPASRDRTLLRIGGAGLRLPGSWHKGDQFVTVRVLESGAPVAQLRSDPTDERDAAHG